MPKGDGTIEKTISVYSVQGEFATENPGGIPENGQAGFSFRRNPAIPRRKWE